MSPRNRASYLAEREADAVALRAKALHRYARAHITRGLGETLGWIREIRESGTVAVFKKAER